MKDMKDVFEKQPIAGEAPQGLRNKVEFAARQKPRRNWFAPGYRWAAAATLAAAAVVGIAMIMAPSKAEAKTWDMVTSAYQKVRGVLIQMSFDGKNERGTLTIAGKGNDWHVSIDGIHQGKSQKMDLSYTRGDLTIWDGRDTAQVISLGMQLPFSPEQIMQGMTEELTASKIFKEHADEIGRNNIRVEQPVTVDGQRVYNVYITSRQGEGQLHVLVNAETDLPMSMEIMGDNGTAMRMKFQFNGDFDDSYLQPLLPSGIKFKYMDKNELGGQGADFMKGMAELGKEMDKRHDPDHKPVF